MERNILSLECTRDVMAITNSEGEIVAESEYDTWGIPTKVKEDEEVKGNPYRYAGYRFDEETGFYYLIARHYEPKNGVFLSLDPDPGSDGNSLDQNGYTYGTTTRSCMLIQTVIGYGLLLMRDLRYMMDTKLINPVKVGKVLE